MRVRKHPDRYDDIPQEEKDIIASHKPGVNSYVVKPLGFTDFSKTIAELGFYWLVINNPPLH